MEHRGLRDAAILLILAACSRPEARTDVSQPGPDLAPAESLVAVRAGHLLDIGTGTLTDSIVLIISRGTVVAAGRDVAVPAGARVVDAMALTILPGLIDAHVHLTLGGRPRDNARRTVEAGFTTVADLGSANGLGFRIQRLVTMDSVPGPNIIAAGSWIGGRGGVCEFGGATIRGDSAAALRAEQDLLAGAQLLKVCVTDWLDAVAQAPDSVELTDAELDAVARVGRRADVPLVAHAIGPAGVALSLRAGVRFFAHAPLVDSAGASALASSGACVATTMTTLLQAQSAPALRVSFGWMRRAGVRFVIGTDAGVLSHGSNAEELLTLASLGLSPREVLDAATRQAADCLRLPQHGWLGAGSVADMVGVTANPLTDLATLKRPALVIRRGKVIEPRE